MSNAIKKALDPASVRRRPIQSTHELIRINPLHEAGTPPLEISCSEEPMKLSVWAENNVALIEELLLKHGAILFRRFIDEGQEGFQRFTHAIGMKLMNYMEGATPRRALGDHVYTSTEFPPEHPIALHNENSYVMTWPMKLCFGCVVAPTDRGETPIADVRKVLHRLTPNVRKQFEGRGYMLVRNFQAHLGLPWQTSFKVSTKEELDVYSRTARIDIEWVGEEHLRTRQVRPAIATHPKTGERIWFNHIAFWHISALPQEVRDLFLSGYGEEGLPYNAYYGDGSPIEEGVIAEIREAYDAETVKFRWERGDLLLVDNMLVAHGRSPYSGPRKIIVSMGEPHTRTDM